MKIDSRTIFKKFSDHLIRPIDHSEKERINDFNNRLVHFSEIDKFIEDFKNIIDINSIYELT